MGARGFNQYGGTIKEAVFDSIETLGDGSIGMQFSKPVGNITIKKDIKTYGSARQTLVKDEFILNGKLKNNGNSKQVLIESYGKTNKSHIKEYILKFWV